MKQISRIRFLIGALIVAAAVLGFGAPAQAWMATGSYTGNGTSQSLSNLGFQPEVVIIKADVLDTYGVIRTSTMSGTKDVWALTAPEANLITSLDADGFSVGSDSRVNASSTTYYWSAFDANSDLVVGTYTGNGSLSTDTQAITVGFSVDYLIIISDAGNRWARNRTRFGGSNSNRIRNAGLNSDTIPSLDAEGFTVQVGADTQEDMNANGVNYHYIAFNEVVGKVKVGSYLGDGSGPDDHTGVGFQPEYILVQSYDSDYNAIQKSDQMSGDLSFSFREALTTNRITALLSDGFQVGGYTAVNASGINYAYVAFNASSAIYYSVGTSTANLRSSDTLTVTISSGRATFSEEQANNIGVGDKIDYDADNKIAYISGRTSSTEYSVITVTGGTPSNVTDATVNSIKRTFNSLSTAVDQSNDAGYLNTQDLVTGKYQLNWPCYNDGADTSSYVRIDEPPPEQGYATGPDNYIRIYTPTDASEVGTSQRHNGTAGTGYRIVPSTSTPGDFYNFIFISNDEGYVRIEGIEIDGSNVSNGENIRGISVNDSTGTMTDNRISHCLIHDITNSTIDTSDESDVHGIILANTNNTKVFNNIIYNITDVCTKNTPGGSNPKGIEADTAGKTHYIYNNTVYNIKNTASNDTAKGIYDSGGSTLIAKDNYVGLVDSTNGGEACFYGTFNTEDYNVSSDTTATGPNSQTGKSNYSSYFVNVNQGSEDLHLQNDSNVLWGTYGEDLDNDANLPVTDDIDGIARHSTQPDIGADEHTFVNYRSIGTSTGTLYSTGTASISSGTTVVNFSGGASLPESTTTINLETANVSTDIGLLSDHGGSPFWSHTVTGSTNTILLVTVAIDSPSASNDITAITYGTQSLTYLDEMDQGSVKVELWFLRNPDTGTGVTITMSTGGGSGAYAAGAMNFTGVNVTDDNSWRGAYLKDKGNSQAPSISGVSSAPGELVVDVVAVDNDEGLTADLGQTEAYVPAEQGAVASGASTKPGAASVDMSWSGVNDGWAAIAVPLKRVVAVGVGDKLTIGAEEFYIFSRDSATQVTVQLAATVDHVAESYTIERAYNTLQAWEDPLASNGRGGDLVADNRIEVGVCYKDGPFTSTATAVLDITDNTTDSTHWMELTVAEGNRHDGTAGATATSNAMIDGEGDQASGRKGIWIRDNQDVRIKWLELKNFSGANYANAVQIGTGCNVLLYGLLIHDFYDDSADSCFGIKLSGSGNNTVTVRNCIIYNGDHKGIAGDEPTDTLTIENCTVYGVLGDGIDVESSRAVVRNNISMNNAGPDFDTNASTTMEYCISEDSTAVGTGCMANRTPTDNSSPVPGNWVIFNNITSGYDFHLQYHATENDALDNGTDLSAYFVRDIDNQERTGDWDIGADEYGAQATAVNLIAFSATGQGTSVIVAWETAQEINNMGFYLYRATGRGGPYVKLTDKLIPGLFSSVMGKQYTHEDTDVIRGELYYYKLEDIDVYGTRTFHGPICVDWDADGLPDDWEIAYGLNPSLNDAHLDSDGDGLTNLEEYEHETDPFNPDSDGDGIPDGEEGRTTDRDITGRTLTKGVEIVASDDTGVTLELLTDAFEAELVEVEGALFERLRVLDYIHGFTKERGKPELPMKGIFLDLPEGKSATLTVEAAESETYAGYWIYPVPQNAVNDEGAMAHVGEVFTIDEAAYSTDSFYPNVVAELGETYSFREQQKLQVVFYPFACNPVTRELTHYTRIRVRVAYEAIGETPLMGLVAQGTSGGPTAALWSPPSEAPAFKVLLSDEGIYRLTKAFFTGNGIDVSGMDLSQVRLYSLGEEVAIYVQDGGTPDQFDDGDYIEFYGRPVEAAYAKYAKHNVYWLTTSGGTGNPKRMATVNGAPGTGELASAHTFTVVHEKDERYWMGAPGGDSLDRWFFNDLVLGDEIFGGGNPVDFTFSILGVSGPGSLTIEVSGYYGTDHEVTVFLNSDPTPVGTFTWSGIAAHQETISPVTLQEGDNTVTLVCETGLDIIYVDSFSVTYLRDFSAASDELIFTHDGGYCYQITELTTNDLMAFDITSHGEVARLTNFEVTDPPAPHTLECEPQTGAGERTYYVFASGAVKTPAGITEDTASTLSDATNGADYILITHRDLGWDGNGDLYQWLGDLVTLRENQGLRVTVVEAEDIYDEFSYGIVTPQAIKDFLIHAYTSWSPPASQYVLLVGDSTFDSKDNLNLGTTNFVPTYLAATEYMGEAPTDEWFVRVSGEDAIPDLYIGRLPAASADQAAVMVNKLILYETTPNTKTWEKGVLLVADNQTEDYETVFETMSEEVAALIPAAMNDPLKGYLGDYLAPADLTDFIKEKINEGTLILNYSGHGSTQIWADEHIFDSDDVPDLTNDYELVFMVNMTCLTGYFAYPELGSLNLPSLGEILLRSKNKGTVAALMPTGMTTPLGQHVLDTSLFDALFTEDIRTVGPAIAHAKQTLLANGSEFEEVSETFLLFGDPAMTLKVPVPHRPTGVSIQITADGVSISWSAVTDCNGKAVSGYNVFRSTSPSGAYEKINTALITETEYIDTSAEVGTTYYYVVKSVDTDGDESVQSLQLSTLAGIGTGSGSRSSDSCFIATVAGALWGE